LKQNGESDPYIVYEVTKGLFNIFTKFQTGYLVENNREGKRDESDLARRHHTGAVFVDRISAAVSPEDDTSS
jgi:hypothetical protein